MKKQPRFNREENGVVKLRKIVSNAFIYVFLATVLVVTLFPVLYTISASFMSNMEIMSGSDHFIPKSPSLDNYIQAWNSNGFDLKQLLFNSTYYTMFCVLFTVLTSSICGYVFSRGEFRGKKIILAMFSTGLFFTMAGGVTIYPIFKMLNAIHLNKSLTGLLVMKLFGVNIVNLYLVRSYVNMLPKEIDEAAEIDGCNFATTFFRIILPLLKPILATIAILAFQGSWNEYLMPTIFTISNPSERTLIVAIMALKNSGEAASSWNLMFAGSVIAMLPVMIAYAFANKYFVEGISAGAVKG